MIDEVKRLLAASTARESTDYNQLETGWRRKQPKPFAKIKSGRLRRNLRKLDNRLAKECQRLISA